MVSQPSQFPEQVRHWSLRSGCAEPSPHSNRKPSSYSHKTTLTQPPRRNTCIENAIVKRQLAFVHNMQADSILAYSNGIMKMVRATGLEPVQPRPRDFKSLASTSFATPACGVFNILRHGRWEEPQGVKNSACLPAAPSNDPSHIFRPKAAADQGALGLSREKAEKARRASRPPRLCHFNIEDQASLAASLATWAPWYLAPSSSISEGWREPSPLVMVEAP